MKINTPWIKEVESGAQKDYEYTRDIMQNAWVNLPAWDELTEDIQRDLITQHGDRLRKISERPMITLKSLSHDIYSARCVRVIGKETYTSFHLYFNRHGDGVFAGQTGLFGKVALKEVDSFDIQWIHADPEFKLRLIITFNDFSKETIEGAETVFTRKDLKSLHGVIRESSEYLSYYGRPMPKLYY